MKLISFEYILLHFKKLIEWVFAEKDELKNKRSNLINIRTKLLAAVDKKEPYYQIKELKEWISNIETYNIEKISAKLLFELTRNTGFETGKSNLGQCFKIDCCNFRERQEDDICGLDVSKPVLNEKMHEIYLYSCLKESFSNVGMEATK